MSLNSIEYINDNQLLEMLTIKDFIYIGNLRDFQRDNVTIRVRFLELRICY